MSNSIRKAVSVILKYKDEVFFVQRQNHLRAFPGYTAFPGGKQDRTDSDLIETVKREVEEELKYLIKDDALITLLAKATSPDFNPVRFETYFYLIELNIKPHFEVDENEVFLHDWQNPRRILEFYQAGQILLISPIKKILEKLLERNLEYVDFDLNRFDKLLVPTIETIFGLKQIMPLSSTILPATRTNAFLLGDNEKVLIDPSPKNHDEYLKFLKTVQTENIQTILISHHHGDHHQFAPQMARELSVPIKISEDSYKRILTKDSQYFDQVEIVFLKDKDFLVDWIGKKVRVYSIPGHDEGHFGFAPDSMEWFIVGDLFQGVGTVVVGGAEGDMIKYMQSLRQIVELKPKCVIPSHGIALGGTKILEKTLKHRLLRETQILELLKNNKTIDEILDIIYFNIPVGVLKYARANIIAHIDKLETEGFLLKD